MIQGGSNLIPLQSPLLFDFDCYRDSSTREQRMEAPLWNSIGNKEQQQPFRSFVPYLLSVIRFIYGTPMKRSRNSTFSFYPRSDRTSISPFAAGNMCESHTFYHLCGHVKIRMTVQCAEMIDRLIASDLQKTCTHMLCGDVSDNTHIFPHVCDRCQQDGVIGDWMEQPGVKYEVLKAWKKENSRPPADNEKRPRGGEDDLTELETLEPIAISDKASLLGTGSPSSSTSSGSTTELISLKNRVASLKTRTERLLTKIRAQKPPKLGQ